jgi:hypothetical protein
MLTKHCLATVYFFVFVLFKVKNLRDTKVIQNIGFSF